MSFDDTMESVTLVSSPLGRQPGEPSRLTLKWYDRPEIKLLFGNGSLASLQSVLGGGFAGRDHRGDFDFEFEVIYDVVDCARDAANRLPLPRIMNQEILRVPCISTMATPPAVEESQVAPAPPAIHMTREPGPAQRRLGREMIK